MKKKKIGWESERGKTKINNNNKNMVGLENEKRKTKRKNEEKEWQDVGTSER